MIIWFFKGSDNWYGRAIRFMTKSPYSHCLLQFRDGTSFSASHTDGGTRFLTEEETKTALASSPSDWDSISLSWITSPQEQRIRAYCEQEHYSEYDYVGVLFGWVNTNYQSRRRWFCSEICLSAILPYTKGIRDKWYSPGGLYIAIRDAVVWNKK